MQCRTYSVDERGIKKITCKGILSYTQHIDYFIIHIKYNYVDLYKWLCYN